MGKGFSGIQVRGSLGFNGVGGGLNTGGLVKGGKFVGGF